MILEIKDLMKSFPKKKGEMVAIADFDLDVEEGEFVCILGPSGCGKTTILRIIAGLESQTRGKILLNGKEISGPGSDRGMVFQEFALFPWRTVRRNVEFGLELKTGLSRERDVHEQTAGLKCVGGCEEIFRRGKGLRWQACRAHQARKVRAHRVVVIHNVNHRFPMLNVEF